MPLDLTNPLNEKSASPDVKSLLKDLQGNILKGHGRGHTANIFLTFTASKAPAVKAWIANFADSVTPAGKQLAETEKRKAHFENQKRLVREGKQPIEKKFASDPILLLFLSASGYDILKVAVSKRPQGSQAWLEGMKKRKDTLSDPDESEWDSGLQGSIHGMILIADEFLENVDKLVADLRGQLSSLGVTVNVERGKAWKNSNGDGIEHFGYVDGRSQPLVLVSDIEKEQTETDGTSVWSPEFPLSQALVKDPAGTGKSSFGSYFVFRKLEQNVRKFKEMEDDLAKLLGLEGEDEERAGALIVGRFEDGTPVVLQDSAGMHSPVPNNFDFRDDPEATKCPFHSHIRKTNPRGESAVFLKEFGVTVEEERSHLMLRRGITYGERRHFTIGEGVEFKDQPDGGVGLLFMAYQSNIENQFEFTQVTWANNADFVKPDTGIDPVIGQGGPGGQECPMHWGGSRRDMSPDGFKKFDFRNAVTMKGGEYFFAPSISGLKNL